MKLPDRVSGTEKLYRVVKRSKPDHITSNKRVSPALFKDRNGVSVDRDGDREEREVIRFIIEETFQSRAKGITVVPADYCFEIGANVDSKPSEKNPFHANII